jgi:orotidine-5'-phosphate decarboxylase
VDRVTFADALRRRWATSGSLLCVGLDPDPAAIPEPMRVDRAPLLAWCREIADATADLVCAFKPQFAHFAAAGAEDELGALVAHLHGAHPDVPVILDAKRGDIGSTARHYAAEAFDRYGADAVTVNPYLGGDALAPFLERADRGVFVLCRTSNPGGADLQALDVGGAPLYEHVARKVSGEWNPHGQTGLVVGATAPEELARVRLVAGDLPILVPGIGAQGGDVAAAVRAGVTRAGTGLLVNSSRAVVQASAGADFAEAARAVALATRDRIRDAVRDALADPSAHAPDSLRFRDMPA